MLWFTFSPFLAPELGFAYTASPKNQSSLHSRKI
jgi:hypothetical protein